MFRGDLLIDGYNLLHAAGLAKRTYGPGEFERCRQRLLKLLASQLFDRERHRTTVVFDAPQQPRGPTPSKTIHGMRIIFADGSGDADDVIELLIRQNSAPRRLHVVSSDHRLQRSARRRRARFYDSEVFLARILDRLPAAERDAQAEPIEKRDGLSAAREIDAWLRTFSFVDPASPLQEGDLPPLDSSETPTSLTAEHLPEVVQEKPANPDEVEFWERRVSELGDERDPIV